MRIEYKIVISINSMDSDDRGGGIFIYVVAMFSYFRFCLFHIRCVTIFAILYTVLEKSFGKMSLCTFIKLYILLK